MVLAAAPSADEGRLLLEHLHDGCHAVTEAGEHYDSARGLKAAVVASAQDSSDDVAIMQDLRRQPDTRLRGSSIICCPLCKLSRLKLHMPGSSQAAIQLVYAATDLGCRFAAE